MITGHDEPAGYVGFGRELLILCLFFLLNESANVSKMYRNSIFRRMK